ncbi:MAG TPA: hypothetical protein EYQ20_07095 [candidate division Zixibacteria bacterium]|nr:hypothetical protein [candidate division Zixibacteria bacterium]
MNSIRRADGTACGISHHEPQTMEKMKLIGRDGDDVLHPTVSGVLMAMDEPESFVSSAYIEAVCHHHVEQNAAYPLDAKDITGPLDVQIQEVYKFVERNMLVYAIRAPNRIYTPQFSMNAAFQAIVNAVVHREYPKFSTLKS